MEGAINAFGIKLDVHVATTLYFMLKVEVGTLAEHACCLSVMWKIIAWFTHGA